MALATLVLLVSASSAAAQIPVGGEFRVDTGGATRPIGMYPKTRAAAMAPDGSFVVVWGNPPGGSSGVDVFARRFDAGGRPTGAEFRVNSNSTGHQYNPSIAADEGGNLVVIWSHELAGEHHVRGQKFDASGMRMGAEFQVDQTPVGWEPHPTVSMRPSGEFVVAWQDENYVIFAREYDVSAVPMGGEIAIADGGIPAVGVDASGAFVVVGVRTDGYPVEFNGRRFSVGGVPQGAPFAVSATPSGPGRGMRVVRRRDGAFTVAWEGGGTIQARRFDATGTPLGSDLLVNASTTGWKSQPDLALDDDGGFVVAWTSAEQDGSSAGVFARRFDPSGMPGPEFQVNTYTTSDQFFPSAASDPAGNFVVTWHSTKDGVSGLFAQRHAGGLMGRSLSVDASSGPASDGNGVFEGGETVAVAPSWLNANFTAQTFTGAATSFTGPGAPGNPTYTIVDGAAAYGTVASGDTSNCSSTGDCYALGIPVPSTRPALHWDATLREEVSPANLGGLRNWPVHVGDSFTDVPRASGFYRFVETLLHHSVTGGCTTTTYCPASPAAREQMAVFVLVAKEGPGYAPPSCTTPVFNDVPASSPFCPWIEELARRGVVGGCGGGNYCPTAPVSREQMAVFVLVTKEPGVTPPACVTPMFADVGASSPFCPWIEELARRGVVAGCGGGNYCPAAPVTREQMAVFLTATFGLTLYGP